MSKKDKPQDLNMKQQNVVFRTKHPPAKKRRERENWDSVTQAGAVTCCYSCYFLLVLGAGDLFNNLPLFRYKASEKKQKPTID